MVTFFSDTVETRCKVAICPRGNLLFMGIHLITDQKLPWRGIWGLKNSSGYVIKTIKKYLLYCKGPEVTLQKKPDLMVCLNRQFCLAAVDLKSDFYCTKRPKGIPYMTSAQKAGERGQNAPNMHTNSIDFADKEGGRGSKIPKFRGRHPWKPPK